MQESQPVKSTYDPTMSKWLSVTVTSLSTPGSEHRGSQAVCYSMRASGILVGFFRPAAVLALALVGDALSWLSWARVAATSALNSSTASCIRSPP